MRASCPHMHLTHSQWRLRIYAELFTPSLLSRSLYTEHGRKQVRHHSTGTGPENQSASDENSTKEKIRKFTQVTIRKHLSRPEDKLPTEEDSAGLKISRFQVRPDLKVKKYQLLPDSKPSGESQQTKARQPRKRWSPYSDQGQHDLKNLYRSIQASSLVKGESEQGDQREQQGDALPPRKIQLPDLPRSPIFEKPLDQRPKPKRRPTPEEKALERDPWAQILASPVRSCNATKVRLPIPLLTNWGLAKHPETGTVFIVPDSLADLEKLEALGVRQMDQSRNSLSQSSDVNETDSDTQVKDFALFRSEDNPKSLLKPLHDNPADTCGNVPAIRILPSANVVGLLTDMFTYVRAPNDPSSEIEVKPGGGGVGRLLPSHWRERITRARHFEHHRKQVERNTGIKDFREPSVESTIDYHKLGWQPDMEERLLSLLRRRVAIILKRVVELATTTEQNIRQRRVSAKPHLVDVIERNGDWGAFLGSSTEKEASDDENDVWHDEMETMDKKVDIGNDQMEISGGQKESLTSDAGCPPTMEPMPPNDEEPWVEASHRYFVPRILLHLSPDPTHERLGRLPVPPVPGMKSTVQQDDSENAGLKTNPLFPPLLAVSPEAFRDEHRTPIFPLHAMLGSKCYEEAIEILRPLGNYGAPGVAPRQVSLQTEQVISVRGVARYGDVLFQEIFRLWRYVGGRACMEWSQAEADAPLRNQAIDFERINDRPNSTPSKEGRFASKMDLETFAAMFSPPSTGPARGKPVQRGRKARAS